MNIVNNSIPGVKLPKGMKLLADKDDTFFKELVMHHISGQLKVAPEHVSDNVLSKMGKPANKVYERFIKKYKKYNEIY